MKKEFHPELHPVVFIDAGADVEFVSRSTMTSDSTRVIDGVEHFEIRLDISSASHPFFTGKQNFIDTAGRIEKFQRKYGNKKKPAAEAPAAEAPAAEAPAAEAPSAE